MSNSNREIAPEAVVTLRGSLRDAGLAEDVAIELEMHIKESVHLQRRELLDGYLRWRLAYEIEHGGDESVMLDSLSRACDACLAVYPQAASVWINTPSTNLSISEARVSLLDDSENGRLAAEYLELLFASNRRSATQLILERVEAGLSIEHLYLHVFQPALMEIGRLWQINALAVGQEHFCAAATQATMAQLYPRIFSHEPIGRQVVATTVQW
ncbi:MAG: B12-binding domain-containing protein [Planctomycetales bacterium]